jgi:hypothetical protein
MHRTARFLPDSTQVRALQTAGRPPVGYANLKFPLELPGTHMSMWREHSDEQTKRVLQHKPPGAPPDNDAPVSPLPMRGQIAANENQPPTHPTFSSEDSVLDLQGFELTDLSSGVRLVFPRGW